VHDPGDRAEGELKSCVRDLLAERPHYEWDERSSKYYPILTTKEFDRLCFFIERETGRDTEKMTLYKFLATLEAIEASQPSPSRTWNN
jgi:hypothetical protein